MLKCWGGRDWLILFWMMLVFAGASLVRVEEIGDWDFLEGEGGVLVGRVRVKDSLGQAGG